MIITPTKIEIHREWDLPDTLPDLRSYSHRLCKPYFLRATWLETEANRRGRWYGVEVRAWLYNKAGRPSGNSTTLTFSHGSPSAPEWLDEYLVPLAVSVRTLSEAPAGR